MNTDTFFSCVRQEPFGGHLTQPQVDGLTQLLSTNKLDFGLSSAQFAYVLATAFHETAHTMQPVEEAGRGKGHIYGLPDPITKQIYFGRGYVQLTWKQNYQRASEHLGIDLVNNPERALEPRNAAVILFLGLIEGWFAAPRAKLSTYINDVGTDYVLARRLVNKLDKAELIAGYARAFAVALTS